MQHTSLTLRTAYEQHHRSTTHRPRTHEKFLNLLTWWERFTGDPPVSEITNQTLLAFKESALAHMRPTTFNGLLGHLNAILATIGPACHGNPYGLGLIEFIARVRPAKERKIRPRVATLDETSRIYLACTDPDICWPRVGIDPGHWWQALIVVLFNLGLRRNDFLDLRRNDISLSRGLVTCFQAEKSDDEDRQLPLHPCVVQHLERIWSPARGVVFPCSKRYMDRRPNNHPKQLYDYWYRIQKQAGLEAPYCFHELRKTCGTEFFRRSPGAAQEMLGHSSVETTRKYYANMSRDLIETAATLDQPAAFVAGNQPPDDPPPEHRFRIVG